MESRLEVFVGGSGFGLFSRFISVSKIISLFIVMDILFHKNKYSMFYSVSSCGVILFFIMAAFLSGSKGEFITIGYILFIYVTLNPLSRIKHKPAFLFLKKNEKKIILAGFLLAILTISTKSDEKSYIESLALLGFRILRFGDVYFYAYPNGYIENLNGSSSFYALFKDFLGLIRIVSWENLPQTLGIDLYLMHHYTDTIEGPNARHNVFGYVHFGYYGSIIFSIIIGSLVGFVRSLIFNAQNYSFLLKIILMVIFANIYVMETDPVYGLSLVNSVIIVMPVIFLLSTLLYAAYKSVQINGITNSNPQYN
jgi:hypothetical protein